MIATLERNRNSRRSYYRRSAALAPLLALALLTGGCQDDVQREFRAAAGDSIEAGVNAILDGLVTGVFAVIEPEEEATEADGG